MFVVAFIRKELDREVDQVLPFDGTSWLKFQTELKKFD